MSRDFDFSAEVKRFFKCWKVVLEMLQDRGYVIQTGDLTKELSAFDEEWTREGRTRARFNIFAEHKDDSNETIFVFFPDEEKIGMEQIRDVALMVEKKGFSRGMVIIPKTITPFGKRALERLNLQIRIEMFLQSELMINITKHVLVPKHIVLSQQQKEELLKEYRLQPSQLPKMQSSDPVARYFGLNKGQVVKIIRPSETAGRYVTYRMVK